MAKKVSAVKVGSGSVESAVSRGGATGTSLFFFTTTGVAGTGPAVGLVPAGAVDPAVAASAGAVGAAALAGAAVAAGTLGSDAATGGTSGTAGNVTAGEGAAAGGAPAVPVDGVVARGAGDRRGDWADARPPVVPRAKLETARSRATWVKGLRKISAVIRSMPIGLGPTSAVRRTVGPVSSGAVDPRIRG